MILDYYYKRPVLIDYFLGLIIAFAVFLVCRKYGIDINLGKSDNSISTEIANSSLTFSGFVITFLTLLITFKNGSSSQNVDGALPNKTIFDSFLSSPLYFSSTTILKNCVKSLIGLAIIGYVLLLSVPESIKSLLFYYSILGLVIILLTIWRCIYVLSKIIDFQVSGQKDDIEADE